MRVEIFRSRIPQALDQERQRGRCGAGSAMRWPSVTLGFPVIYPLLSGAHVLGSHLAHGVGRKVTRRMAWPAAPAAQRLVRLVAVC